MKRNPRPRGPGRKAWALWAIILFAIVALPVLMVVSSMIWSTGRDVGTGQVSLDALHLAQGAADELSLAFVRLANDPQSPRIGRSIRVDFLRAPAGRRWVPPPADLAELEQLPVTRGLLVTTGNALTKYRLVKTSLEITVLERPAGLEPAEVKARAEFAATVEGETQGGRKVTRTVKRSAGLRVSRLGLPWPFDSLALFVRDAPGLLGDAPAWTQEVAVSVQNAQREMAESTGGMPAALLGSMAATKRRLDDVVQFFSGRGNGLPWTDASFYTGPAERLVTDLALHSVRAQLEPEIRRFREASRQLAAGQERVNEAVRQRDVSGLQAAFRAMDSLSSEYVAAAESYRDRLRATLARWTKVSRVATVHARTFGAGIAVVSSLPTWKQAAWFKVPGPEALGKVFPGGPGAARNGIVLLEGTGATRLSDGVVWGPGHAPGRLVLVASGPTRVQDLTAGQGLVTVVSAGPLEVSGHVEANLVALSGLTVAPGARLRGQVYVHQGDVILGAGARLERNESTVRSGPSSPPAAALFHVALDPFLVTTEQI